MRGLAASGVPAALAVLGGLGCGGEGDVDPDECTMGPCLRVSMDELDLGEVPTGEVRHDTLRFSAEDQRGDVRLSDVSIEGADAGVFTHDAWGRTGWVREGEPWILTIGFAPVEVRDYEADLVVSHNGLWGEIEVSLSGTGVPAP